MPPLRLQFSMRQLGTLIIAVSALVPILKLIGVEKLGSVFIHLSLPACCASYVGYYWWSSPALRVHWWKAPWMLGLFSICCGFSLWCLFDIFEHDAHLNVAPVKTAFAFAIHSLLFLGALLCLLVTPLRLTFRKRGNRRWNTLTSPRLLNSALILGPIVFTVLIVVARADIVEYLVGPVVGFEHVGWFYVCFLVFAGSHMLASVAFLAALVVQSLAGFFMPRRTAVCFLYAIGWFVFLLYNDGALL